MPKRSILATPQDRPDARDLGSNVIGAAFGAWVTDAYVLKPVVSKDTAGHRAVPLVLQGSF